LLQGWAIVDSTVGEDWDGAELSLVAGAPHSFIQQLSEPAGWKQWSHRDHRGEQRAIHTLRSVCRKLPSRSGGFPEKCDCRAGTAAALVFVALVACVIHAQRAGHLDPAWLCATSRKGSPPCPDWQVGGEAHSSLPVAHPVRHTLHSGWKGWNGFGFEL